MTDEIADVFRYFAVTGYGDEAPTYALLSGAVADDPDILAIVAAAAPERRIPNNLFAAVRFLLLGGADHPLAAVYDAIAEGGPTAAADELVPSFVDFVHRHRAETLDAIAFRSIQTNEPARCAHIAAGLAFIQQRHGPLAMLDVGTSAGLNLQVDRCNVDFGSVTTGPADSPLQLSCRLLGDGRPPVGEETLSIAWRHGLDRDPIDVEDEPSRRWLQSCVWIDQADRNDRLVRAIELARANPAAITTGDAIDDLAAVLAMAPADLHLVVITTWVLFYLDTDQRAALDAILAGAGRPISWLSLEYPGVAPHIDRPTDRLDDPITPSVLGLVSYDGMGARDGSFLGWAHHHGAWLDWRR